MMLIQVLFSEFKGLTLTCLNLELLNKEVTKVELTELIRKKSKIIQFEMNIGIM